MTAKSGKAILETVNKSKIECTSSEVKEKEGELTEEQTLGRAVFHFLGCKAFSLPMNSVGDPAETILVEVLLHNCVIQTGDAGLLFKLDTPLHVNVPAVSLLIVFTGSFIVLVEENKKSKVTYKLNIKQTAGKQEVEKCEGGVKNTLTVNTDEKGAEEAAEAIEAGTLTFAVAQEVMV